MDYLEYRRSEIFTDDAEMNDWIIENYQMRLDTAHGLVSSNLSTFERNEALIPRIRHIATIFLMMFADERRKKNGSIDEILKHANKGHLPFGVTPANSKKGQPDDRDNVG